MSSSRQSYLQQLQAVECKVYTEWSVSGQRVQCSAVQCSAVQCWDKFAEEHFVLFVQLYSVQCTGAL